MKTAVLKEFGKLTVEDVSKPEPRHNQVVVKVMACGMFARLAARFGVTPI